MKRLYVSLIVGTLLFLIGFWSTEGAKPEVKPPAATSNSQDERAAKRKAAFRKGRELLARKNVPFDPDELLEPRWQEKLRPALDQMPELQIVQQGDNKLKGAQLAHTLYLPDNIQLTGDTVILVRHLVFLGRNVLIKGNYDIHIFTLEETQLVDNSSLSKNRAGIIKAGFPLTPALMSALMMAQPVQGHITIDTSAPGRGQIQNQRLRETAKRVGNLKEAHHSLSVVVQNADGQCGANGTTGTIGNPGQHGNGGAAGPNGSCSGNINGAAGNGGGDGTAGGAGGNGGGGNPGQTGGNVSFTAQIGQSYTVSANGGCGGNGGAGGFGGQGGNGGSGGNGGNGAACSPCTIGSPSTSSGGQGGLAGFGGFGGDGGNGGNGGRGGDGGTITIQYPSGYNPSNISAVANGGSGGSGGAGGFGGNGGSAGSPGQGGSGDRGFACSGSGNQGSTGGTGSAGSPGDSGNSGQPGANGSQGSVSITEIGGGVEGYSGGAPDCDIDVPPSCSDGIDNDGDWDIDQNDSGCICPSPIVIDTLGNGFDLTTAANGVLFDIADIRRPLQLAWTQGDDAWLVLDRNSNGTIDTGKELFGNFTPQPPSARPHGFLALAEYDKPENGGNSDGRIGPSDVIFSSLRLWQDANRNGFSEPGELFPLLSLDVMGIDLDFRTSRRTDDRGNLFRYRSKVYDRRGGSVGRWAWDVFLATPR